MVYKTKGVCSKAIDIEIENNIIKSVSFVGGCHGNTQGVAKLCEGREVDEVIKVLEGIKCGFRSSSCPDQLAEALKEYKKNN